MKRLFSIGICMILSASLLLGCSTNKSSSGADAAGKKVLFSTPSFEDKFLSILLESAQKSAESNGIELVPMEAENDVTNQLHHVKTAVSEGYGAIIMILVDAESSGQMIAEAGDLPIIFANRSPGEKKLKSDRYIYVGSDENQSAGFQAEFLAKYFSQKGQTDVKAVLFQGQFGHSAAVTRTSAVKEKLKESGLNVEYVFNDSANWSRETSEEMFTNFLKMRKEFDCVICNNDEMAIGVINSMKANGINPSSVPIVGIDATLDGCGAVEDGSMAFTVYQSASGQGESAIRAAALLSTGNSISEIEWVNQSNDTILVPFEPVDASNVAKYK